MSNENSNVYILITQCLQNGFFFADENRLCLPKDAVARMLVGYEHLSDDVIQVNPKTNRRVIAKRSARGNPTTNTTLVKDGPLYAFLNAIVNRKDTDAQLHVINLRDWHAPSEYYDHERRAYGIHCEENTWEAEFIDGYDAVLAPYMLDDNGKPLSEAEAKDKQPVKDARSVKGWTKENSKVTYYDVRSDSVFDFREPASESLKKERNDGLKDSEFWDKENGKPKRRTLLSAILSNRIGDTVNTASPNTSNRDKRVYVVVIGVYTDIKIKTLLTGLRTRYNINSLIVSDVLTASPTYERHLEALDYIDKVQQVEIVHSLDELLHVLEPSSSDVMPRDIIKNQLNFNEYRSYFRDKQLVLSYQDTRMLQYLELTSQRSQRVYQNIESANQFLIQFGQLMLVLTVVLGVAKFLENVLQVTLPGEVLLITGGLTVAQLLTSYFLIPMAQMRNNVNALVRLRNYLETYSSISALLRFHMTKFNSLHLPLDYEQRKNAILELAMLSQRIRIIQEASHAMSQTFQDIPISADSSGARMDANSALADPYRVDTTQLLGMLDNIKPESTTTPARPIEDEGGSTTSSGG